MDNIESRARKGEKLEERTGGFACYCMKMLCEKEFGIEYKAEVSKIGTPGDSSMLKLGYGWSSRTTYSSTFPKRLVCVF
jgi:hypothetical protein